MLELEYIIHLSVEVDRVVDEVAVRGGERACATLRWLYVHQKVIGRHHRLALEVTIGIYKQRRIGAWSVPAQCSIKDLLESAQLVTLHCARMCE